MCPRGQKFVHYSENDKNNLAWVSKMTEVVILGNLEFVGHERIQNSGVSWTGGYALRYNIYAIAQQADLKYEAAVVYGALFGFDKQLSGMDEGEASDKVSDKSRQDRNSRSSDSDPQYSVICSKNVLKEIDYTTI